MDERYPDEFVTWRHSTPLGVKVDEVFGMDSKTGKTWLELARQIYCEQGQPDYREISHFESGAPFIEGWAARISITHTTHFFAVASLPKTPEVALDIFNPRTAMGIDAELADRIQVLKIRNKFLSARESELISEDNLSLNIQAWTVKEALYKAAFCEGIDFKNNLQIISLPNIAQEPLADNHYIFGQAQIVFPEKLEIPVQDMKIYSYLSYGCIVSLVISPKAARWGS